MLYSLIHTNAILFVVYAAYTVPAASCFSAKIIPQITGPLRVLFILQYPFHFAKPCII